MKLQTKIDELLREGKTEAEIVELVQKAIIGSKDKIKAKKLEERTQLLNSLLRDEKDITFETLKKDGTPTGKKVTIKGTITPAKPMIDEVREAYDKTKYEAVKEAYTTAKYDFYNLVSERALVVGGMSAKELKKAKTTPEYKVMQDSLKKTAKDEVSKEERKLFEDLLFITITSLM